MIVWIKVSKLELLARILTIHQLGYPSVYGVISVLLLQPHFFGVVFHI
jgi:hypothetical protein